MQIATEALEVPLPQRHAFVAGICGENEELRSLVVTLLDAAEDGASEKEQDAAIDVTSAPTEDLSLAARTSSVSSNDGGRFLPGTIIDGRYRIVAMLGRGGMGEVYRADDLKLGQTVALKFLPLSLEKDARRGERFLSEVRLARQVAHRNVCRVWDIGEADGHPFLSMEYVDGEDLAALLRRIGRLPEEKALQIARQICSALAAVHEAGIIHRDLKPGNVMLDGRGKAKLTDFGLALAAETGGGREAPAGTPAYMAPEQLSGNEATSKSDIYALGLILYELLTGKQVFDADSPAEYLKLRHKSHPRPPADWVDLDPAVERAIMQCLEQDPELRPASARAVAALLPGGDALAAALAAGETPSPDMVADAGVDGRLPPAVGGLLLATVLFGLIAVAGLNPKVKLVEGTPLPKSPAVLADRAREAAAKLGHIDAPNDRAFGFSVNQPYLRHLSAVGAGGEALDRTSAERPSALLFDYWESSGRLVGFPPGERLRSLFQPRGWDRDRLSIQLDPSGRLFRFEAPAPEPAADNGDGGPQWDTLFKLAGLDENDFRSVAPVSRPPIFGNRVVAWEGVYPDSPEIPVRVEAAADGSVVVFFRIAEPWEPAPRLEAEALTSWITLVALVAAAFVARFNVRRGRGDLRGALRCGLYISSVSFLGWPLVVHHSGGASETRLLFLGLSTALFTGATVWICYLAIEPFVRRYWPGILVSWNRLLDGRFRDSLVARDLLIGSLFGVVLTLVAIVTLVAPEWFGGSRTLPWSLGLDFTVLNGFLPSLGEILMGQANTAFYVLPLLVILVALRMATGRTWVAVAGLFVLGVAPNLIGVHSALGVLQVVLNVALAVTVLFRVGLLPVLVGLYLLFNVFGGLPLTLDPSVWYAPSSFLAFGLVIAVALYGLRWSISLQSSASMSFVPPRRVKN